MLVAIPGYADACRRVEARRDRAWVDADPAWTVCGCPLRAMRVRDYARLCAVGSWLVGRSEPTWQGCAAALWLLSPDHGRRGLRGWWARTVTTWRAWRADRSELVRGLDAYASEQLADAQAHRAGMARRAPLASMIADLVSTLATDYRMSVEQAQELPIAQALQLVRLSCARAGVKIEWTDEAERLKLEWLRDTNERAARRRAEMAGAN